jgi:hypothetical protein
VLRRVLVGVVGGVVAGTLLGLLAWSASGAAGPGRLAHVGPDPLLVGLFAALEVAVPSVLAMVVSLRSFLGHDDDAQPARAGGERPVGEAVPDPVPVPAGGTTSADDVATGPQPVLSTTSASGPSRLWSRLRPGRDSVAGPTATSVTDAAPRRQDSTEPADRDGRTEPVERIETAETAETAERTERTERDDEHDDERDGPAPWWRRLGSPAERPAPEPDSDETEPIRGLDR